MKFFYLFILLQAVLYSKTLTVATGEWNPWVSKELKNYGVASHITQEAFKTQGIETKFLFYPWKRAYIVTKTTRNDASGFWLKTQERQKDFYFSDEVFSIKNKLIFKKSKPIRFNTIDDLKKYKIAITRGYSYTQKIDTMIQNKEIDVHVVSSDLAGLNQVLRKNNFDAFLCSENVARTLINENFTPKEKEEFELSSKEVFKNTIHLIVSKQHNEHEKILSTFNKGLKELKKKNLIQKMINASYEGNYK